MSAGSVLGPRAAARIRAAVAAASRIVWPSERYVDDPVGFFRDILGLNPWSRQIEIIESVRDHQRVAVTSGHKTGKSNSAAGLALWFYSSFPDARVIMSSTTARQVDTILWRELRMMFSRAGKCLACKREDPYGRRPPPCPHSAALTGEIHELARSGLKSSDFREVFGFTAREPEAVAGISGGRMLYILDEASGIPEPIFEAVEGNRAGGAKIVMFSNPTRTEGTFFKAFHDPRASKEWRRITVSSEETPNVVQGRLLIPGLATREWVEEKRREWGEDSALYKVRVKGEFVLHEDGKILSVHAIAEAVRRCSDEETPPVGRLCVGLDPAGEGGMGDESVMVARRGLRMVDLEVMRGLDHAGHLAHLLRFVGLHRRPDEEPLPLVIVDREGSIGAPLYRVLRLHSEDHPGLFEVRGVRASDKARRQPDIYDRARDELWGGLAAWLREGGAIIDDPHLQQELHAPQWGHTLRGQLKATSKDDLRRILGRSPDRADALALAVWEASPLDGSEASMGAEDGAAPPAAAGDDFYPLLDPYAGVDYWTRGGR